MVLLDHPPMPPTSIVHSAFKAEIEAAPLAIQTLPRTAVLPAGTPLQESIVLPPAGHTRKPALTPDVFPKHSEVPVSSTKPLNADEISHPLQPEQAPKAPPFSDTKASAPFPEILGRSLTQSVAMPKVNDTPRLAEKSEMSPAQPAAHQPTKPLPMPSALAADQASEVSIPFVASAHADMPPARGRPIVQIPLPQKPAAESIYSPARATTSDTPVRAALRTEFAAPPANQSTNATVNRVPAKMMPDHAEHTISIIKAAVPRASYSLAPLPQYSAPLSGQPMVLNDPGKTKVEIDLRLFPSEPAQTHSYETRAPDLSQPLAPKRGHLPPQIAAQIADVVRQMPNRPVDIALSPDELGSVRLSVATSEAGIMVHVLAERPETLDLLRRHINQLGQEFRDLGFADISFSFAGGEQAPTNSASQEGRLMQAATASELELAALTNAPAPPTLAAGSLPGLDLRL